MNKQEKKKTEQKRMIDRAIRASIKSAGQSAPRIELKRIFLSFLLIIIDRSNANLAVFSSFLFPPPAPSYLVYFSVIAMHETHEAHGRRVLTITL